MKALHSAGEGRRGWPQSAVELGLALGIALGASSCASPGRKPSGDSGALTLERPALDFGGEVFVDFTSRSADYRMVAVLPFKAAVEQAGESISDMFTTELLKTAKYGLIERGQIASVLKEQELGLSGVVDDQMAVELGRILGVQGVVVGSVSEYGLQKVKIARAPSVGLSVRMIDTTTGKIVWSISHTQVGSAMTSLSAQAGRVVDEMVQALAAALIDAGDEQADGLPPPIGLKAAGGVRAVELTWRAHSSALIAGYEIQRRDPGTADFKLLIRIRSEAGQPVSYVDHGLADLAEYAYRVRSVSKYGLSSAAFAEAAAITAGPPPKPLGLRAESGQIRRVPLSWAAAEDPFVVGYAIERSGPDGEQVRIGRVPGAQTVAYEDQDGLQDGASYHYRIFAFNAAEVESEPSAAAEATTCPAPSPVTGLVAKSGLPGKVELAWEPSAEAEWIESYAVYRAESPAGSWMLVAKTKGRESTAHVDAGKRNQPLKNGQAYWFAVAGINAAGIEGEKTGAVAATTKPAPKKATGVRAKSGGVKEVQLQWQKNPEADVQAYRIYRAKGTGGRFTRVAEVEAETRAHVDGGLADGTDYAYQVAAVDADGLEGERSDPVSASTKSPPRPPQGVAFRDLGGRIELAWEESPEADVDKYVVHQRSVMGRKAIGETGEPKYVVEGVKAGSSCTFTVVAVDRTGLQSAPSQPLKCTVAKPEGSAP